MENAINNQFKFWLKLYVHFALMPFNARMHLHWGQHNDGWRRANEQNHPPIINIPNKAVALRTSYVPSVILLNGKDYQIQISNYLCFHD